MHLSPRNKRHGSLKSARKNKKKRRREPPPNGQYVNGEDKSFEPFPTIEASNWAGKAAAGTASGWISAA